MSFLGFFNCIHNTYSDHPKEIVHLESLGGIMEVAIGDPPPFYTRVEMNVLQCSMSAVLERSPGASHYQILKGPTLQSLQTE